MVLILQDQFHSPLEIILQLETQHRHQKVKPLPKKKIQKEEEYPKIPWTVLEKEEVQKAVILYNDRVNSFRKMVEVDKLLDQHPTEELVIELAELRIRNSLCFEELESFNNTGKFVFKHPLVQQFSERALLIALLKNDLDKYLKEYTKATSSVSRYKSFLNTKTEASAKDKEKWEFQLKKHQDRTFIMKQILENNGK